MKIGHKIEFWHKENDKMIYQDKEGYCYEVKKKTFKKELPARKQAVNKSTVYDTTCYSFSNISWARALTFKARLWKYFNNIEIKQLTNKIVITVKGFRFGADTKHRG